MIAAGLSMLNLFLLILYFSLMLFWIVVVFHVLTDIMRSHDLSGTMKAILVLFLLVFPLISALLYLISRGGSMHERQVSALQAQQQAFEDYIRTVANSKE